MSENFSIGIVARLKHGDILEALEKRGWNQHQGAEFFGLSDSAFGNIINMKWKPKKISKKFEQKLFELTGKLPADLWPETVFTKDFLDRSKVVKAIRELPIHQLAGLGFLQLQAAPDEVFEQQELKKLIAETLNTLKPMEAQIIRSRFFDEKTLREIGKELGVNQEKVRQIEAQAFRKLRHRSKSRKLKVFLTG